MWVTKNPQFVPGWGDLMGHKYVLRIHHLWNKCTYIIINQSRCGTFRCLSSVVSPTFTLNYLAGPHQQQRSENWSTCCQRDHIHRNISVFTFQLVRELSECQWCRLNFWRQTSTLTVTDERLKSFMDWSQLFLSVAQQVMQSPWPGPWAQMATCRDRRNRTDHRREVRGGELVKTLVHQYTNLKVYTLSHQKPVKIVTNRWVIVSRFLFLILTTRRAAAFSTSWRGRRWTAAAWYKMLLQ